MTGDWEDYITCPVCGDVDHETCDYPASLDHDGDAAEVDCERCGAVLRVDLCVTYAYRCTVTARGARLASARDAEGAGEESDDL